MISTLKPESDNGELNQALFGGNGGNGGNGGIGGKSQDFIQQEPPVRDVIVERVPNSTRELRESREKPFEKVTAKAEKVGKK